MWDDVSLNRDTASAVSFLFMKNGSMKEVNGATGKIDKDLLTPALPLGCRASLDFQSVLAFSPLAR